MLDRSQCRHEGRLISCLSLTQSEQGARTARIVCAHIYERTTPGSVTVQQDNHIRKRTNTNKTRRNVRHDREHRRTRRTNIEQQASTAMALSRPECIVAINFKARQGTRTSDFKAHYDSWTALKNNAHPVSNMLMTIYTISSAPLFATSQTGRTVDGNY